MSPSGRYLAIPSKNGTVAIKSLADSTSIDFVLATATAPTALRFSADDRSLLVGSASGTASLWDLSSRTSVELGETGLGPLRYAAFLENSGEVVLVAQNDSRVQVWTANGSSHRIIDFGTGNVVQTFGLVQSDEWLAGTAGGNLFVASLTSSVIVQPTGFTGVAWSIAVSPAAGALLVGNDTGAIFKWTLGQSNLSYTVSAHDWRVSSVAIDPAGQEFVTAGYDGMVKRWRVADGVLERAERAGPEHGDFGWHVKFIRGGTMLAGGGSDGQVRVWTKELDSLHAIPAYDYWVSLVDYSESADALITMRRSNVINVWPFGISSLRTQLCASLVDYFGTTSVPGRIGTGGDLCSAP